MSLQYIKEIKENTKIDILIPAAGMGKRMKSYGPKPLIKIKNKTCIFDNQLRIIKKVFGDSANIVIVCGFQSEMLMNKIPNNAIAIENERYEETNVTRSIGMGLRACKKDVLIIYGDLVFNESCLKSMNYNRSSILTGKNIMQKSEVGCIINNKNKAEHLMYDLENKWGQITFFKGKELKLLKDYCWNQENYNKLGFESINYIINNGGSFVSCQNNNNRAIDIDSSKDLEKIKEIL